MFQPTVADVVASAERIAREGRAPVAGCSFCGCVRKPFCRCVAVRVTGVGPCPDCGVKPRK